MDEPDELPPALRPVAEVFRAYAEGRLDLETAAARLIELWDDDETGGWGLYTDDDDRSAEAQRARALERRFHQRLDERGDGERG